MIGDTLPGALSQLFPDLGPPPPPGGGGGRRRRPRDGPPAATDVAGLLAQADTAYNEAQTALKAGNLAEYQKAVDRMAELIRQATDGLRGCHHDHHGATTTPLASDPGSGCLRGRVVVTMHVVLIISRDPWGRCADGHH